MFTSRPQGIGANGRGDDIRPYATTSTLDHTRQVRRFYDQKEEVHPPGEEEVLRPEGGPQCSSVCGNATKTVYMSTDFVLAPPDLSLVTIDKEEKGGGQEEERKTGRGKEREGQEK